MAPGLLDRRLLFVTGKGGVGKSAVATGLAILASRQGKRVLACEIDAKGNLSDFLECGVTTFKPKEVHPSLWAMTMNTEDSLQEYLKLQMRLPLIGRVGPLAKALEFVADAAPGVHEILTIGKLAYEVRERHYDLVVVDASASGHIVAQLGAADAIRELVSVGMVRQQTEWMRELLADEATTGVAIVTTPEEMPVTETKELVERIGAKTDVSIAAVLANRVLPELFARNDRRVYESLHANEVRAALVAATSPSLPTVLRGADLALHLRSAQSRQLDELRADLDPTIPVYHVPELFLRQHGLRATHLMADALATELEGS